jgi:hypothetical protein
MHFSGRDKPWEDEYARLVESLATKGPSASRKSSPLHWFFTLTSAAEEISFNVSRSAFGRRMPVGRFSDSNLMFGHIVAKKERGWTAYQ